jgi:hypothetical protein
MKLQKKPLVIKHILCSQLAANTSEIGAVIILQVEPSAWQNAHVYITARSSFFILR